MRYSVQGKSLHCLIKNVLKLVDVLWITDKKVKLVHAQIANDKLYTEKCHGQKIFIFKQYLRCYIIIYQFKNFKTDYIGGNEIDFRKSKFSNIFIPSTKNKSNIISIFIRIVYL